MDKQLFFRRSTEGVNYAELVALTGGEVLLFHAPFIRMKHPDVLRIFCGHLYARCRGGYTGWR
jgi:hypothetical protein